MECEVRHGGYTADLEYTLLGQWAISPIQSSDGYELLHMERETPTNWYGSILAAMDKDTQMLNFIVRDDSYNVFKRARARVR